MKKFIYYAFVLASISIAQNAYAIDLPTDINNKDNTLDPSLPKLEDLSEKVKITDIVVKGTERKESTLVAMFIKQGDTVSPSQIKEDLQRIYGLGFFKDVSATKEPFLGGYRLVINVIENPILKSVAVEGNTIVTSDKIKSPFNSQIGKILNMNDARDAIDATRKIYSDQGYQAVSIDPKLSPDGSLDIIIHEGVIEEIKVVGNVETKPEIIMREIRQKSGQVFNIDIMRDDLRRVYNTNFFENVDIKPSQGKIDPNHMIIDIVVKEKSTGTVNLGAAYNTRDGIVGTFAISKDNILGNGQRIAADLQAGAGWLSATGPNFLGKLDWYDPWFMPQYLPARTGVGFSLYRQRQGNYFQNINQFSTNFDNGNAFYNYIMINDRTGASVNYSRSIWGDPLTSQWRFSVSLKAEQISPTLPRVDDVSIKFNKLDDKGNIVLDKDKKTVQVDKVYSDLQNSKIQAEKDIADKIKNEFKTYTDNNILRDLTVSKKGLDNRFSLGVSLSYDSRDFAAEPHDGWNNIISVEPSYGDITYWKYFLSLNKYIPMPYLDKWTIAIGGRLGVLFGDPARMSIYERFYSGSFDTIRGWPEYGYLSGENVFVGSAEVRFPIYNIVSGVLFLDAGNFWNQNWKVTEDNIKLDKKDGDVFNQNLLSQTLRYGFGLGLRVNTPLGALRADYGIRDITKPFDLSKGAQFHFNIGQKF